MSDQDPTQRPYHEAIDRVVYLLDRDHAPIAKVRAFLKGKSILDRFSPQQVQSRAEANSLTQLEGIGQSLSTVVRSAYGLEAPTYIERLEAKAIPLGAGESIRNQLKGDCHSHSNWSDGSSELTQMARAAEAIGHQYLVATDHSARLTIAHGLSPERLSEQIAEIETLNAAMAPFRILTGMEVDIMPDGSLDLPDEWLARLDVVIASVHHKIHQPADQMTQRLVTAVANPHVDILGHCTNRKIGKKTRQPSQFDADYVFAACAKYNTTVEINCRPERQDPPEELLKQALEWGCMVAINSDAHAPGQLEWVNYGCDKAARFEIEPNRILNTHSADKLLDLLAT